MSNRAATILAVAAVISSLCMYATSAQVPERPREATEGAIVVGPPPIRLQQELPGRYALSAVTSSSGTVEVVVLDTHTGKCWFRRERTKGWSDWGSPTNQE